MEDTNMNEGRVNPPRSPASRNFYLEWPTKNGALKFTLQWPTAVTGTGQPRTRIESYLSKLGNIFWDGFLVGLDKLDQH